MAATVTGPADFIAQIPKGLRLNIRMQDLPSGFWKVTSQAGLGLLIGVVTEECSTSSKQIAHTFLLHRENPANDASSSNPSEIL
eukprot:CAMPEP_0169207758 /NCGR_PEP_ID=MMETSP1016-20121227/13763_1 /TAXON_ID=342587 /ORGANISM="Karlodinium micrum, Strain CCMP2283" /LENGTH=83 /DNA_ID=CAMNT_0009285075 /DNA_START=530 /DNA_END=778 /DNA_ORIENTATION=-